MQISMPVMLFTDDEEVWMDVIPSDRNAGQNLPISTIPGFMPIMDGLVGCLGLFNGKI